MKRSLFLTMLCIITTIQCLFSQSVTYNQSFALYVEGHGYIKYENRKYGINLNWSEFPVYEWEFRQGAAAGTVKVNVPVALFNRTVSDYVVYASRDFGINLKWLRDTDKKDALDWIVEGDLSGSTPCFWLKNNTLFKKNSGEPYVKYGSRDFGINLVWSQKPAACSFQLAVAKNELSPATLVAGGGTWSFKNFKTGRLDWDSFEEAFSLGGERCDGFLDCLGEAAENLGDYLNPVNYAIFYGANNLADKGNCFGMCLAAAFIAERGAAKLPHVGEVKQQIWNYKDEAKLRKAINVMHWKQLSRDFVDPWLEGLGDSYLSQVQKMQSDIQAGRFGLLSIYKNIGLSGTSGHVMIPYKIDKKIGSNGKYEYWVSVYDPNRPFSNLNNLAAGSHPPVIIKETSFSYLMNDNTTWADELTYVPYKRAKDYDNLLNSLWDLGYVVISDAGELEQISDKDGRKLLKKNNPKSATDFDFSAKGLAGDIFPLSLLGFEGSDELCFSADSITDPFFRTLVRQQQENFGANPLILLVRRESLQNLIIQAKPKSSLRPLRVGIGNAREFVEIGFDKGDVSKIQPEIAVSKFASFASGMNVRNRLDQEITATFSAGAVQKSKKMMEVQEVRLSLRSVKTSFSQNTVREIRVASPHLKGQSLTVSRVFTGANGQKTQLASRVTKVD